MELRMNISGNFSDFMSSDEEGTSSKSSFQNSKSKHYPATTLNKKHTVNKLLPDIEENKSIQAKN
jgi:hypothetical protein